MLHVRRPLLLAAVLAIVLAPAGRAQAVAELKPLAWLVGAPWVGTVGEGPEAATDVSVWSWAVGGHALRNVHAVADGAYGGETLLWWDDEAKAYAFVYVTTGGFATQGHLRLTDGGVLEGIEEVSGGAEGMAAGVDAVRSTTRRADDGRLIISVSYLRDGLWGAEQERVYTRSAEAELPCALDPGCDS